MQRMEVKRQSDINKMEYVEGTIDLAREVKYLAVLAHPHIINIRGICNIQPYERIGYFIVFDYLPELLSKRISTTWIHTERKTTGVTGYVVTGGTKKRAIQFDIERLSVAYDIAKALEYIHSKNIIYRDLVRRKYSLLVFF